MPIEIASGSRWIIDFSRVALRNLQSLNLFRGDDVLLHVIYRPETRSFVLNDCLDGNWGSECTVAAPRDGGLSHVAFELRFLATGLSVAVRGGGRLVIEDRFVLSGEVEASMPRTIALAQPLRAEEDEVLPYPAIPRDGPSGPARDACPEDRTAVAAASPAGATAALAAVQRPAIGMSLSGVLDECAFSPAVGGWLVTGWMPAELPIDGGGRLAAEVKPAEAATGDEIIIVQYPRDDIREVGHAFVLLVPCDATDAPPVPPRQIDLMVSPGVAVRLTRSPGFAMRDEAGMQRLVRDVLTTANRGAVEPLRARIERANFTGEDSFAKLGVPAHVEVDEVIPVRPGAALLFGWCLDPLGLVESIRLCCGAATSAPLEDAWFRTNRQDIVDAFARQYGVVPHDSGFIAWADAQVACDRRLFLEIRLTDGRRGLKPLPQPTRRGSAALRRVLGAASLPGHDLDRIFDRVLGAPLAELNRQRLALPPQPREDRFGTLPAAPRVSLVIPLYGRLDFMRCQLAIFSAQRMASDEIIYVLDQPERTAELVAMAHSAFGSLGMPFRVLLLGDNRGFGPASNAGLAAARGRYVMFLNSDVFPEEADWLDRLVADLECDASTGIVGPLLLFADGTVQHAGMELEPVQELSGWLFPRHPLKGRVPPAGGPRLRHWPAVTGAAMLMRRDLALELGGFDPDFAVGDFEDADLCLRAAALGLRCTVDMSVRARHLERQSQNAGSADWRHNTTLLNAWTFNRRLHPPRPTTAHGG
ncbi:glycosyltransferase [Neoroseomonas soli]|uniref:Glycosyltransferase n=1 Tax=Neoroseomonas soli TaxID=1081025 RepID=A0A9X9WX12_9PROT|nr:glycosyltransferase [Neoroseomonas soli]MBR0671691.1 glycosyltransferase [Neoroseomonas soli]